MDHSHRLGTDFASSIARSSMVSLTIDELVLVLCMFPRTVSGKMSLLVAPLTRLPFLQHRAGRTSSCFIRMLHLLLLRSAGCRSPSRRDFICCLRCSDSPLRGNNFRFTSLDFIRLTTASSVAGGKTISASSLRQYHDVLQRTM